MGCLLAVIALITPRTLLVVLWLFGDYLTRAYDNFLVPFLGFLFLPTTTIAYAVAENSFEGATSGGGLLLIILGVVVDLGMLGGARRGRR